MSTQKNYLITGATSGIGKTIIRQLTSQPASNRLFLISRTEDETLRSLQSDTITYHAGVDLTNLHSQDSLVNEINAFFPTKFVLIHCAGDFWNHYTFLDVNTDEAMQMMESHYKTFYSVLQRVLPLMIERKGGNILTFSCNAVGQFLPNMLPFTAAKAAVEAMVKCIAHEYAGQGIVSNAIALSSLKTEQVKASKPFGDFEHYLDMEDISNIVLEIANLSNHLANGNVISCYEYSRSYYHSGYFDRIRRSEC